MNAFDFLGRGHGDFKGLEAVMCCGMGSGAEYNTRIKNDGQFFKAWLHFLPLPLPGRHYAKPADF